MSDPRPSPFRFWIGMLQMFGAVAAIALLAATGLSVATLVAAISTTALTLTSRIAIRRS